MSHTGALYMRRIVVVAGWALCCAMPRPACAQPRSAATCPLVPDKAGLGAEGREVYCAADLGSRNVKLVVNSMTPGKPLTLRNERFCRSLLNLGTKVYDAQAPTGQQNRPLADRDLEDLVAAVREFRTLCESDGGRMLGADATEWARHATNIKQIQDRVVGSTGTTIDVLSPEQEARYGYLAATHGTRGRIVLDPGSNSFQITWQGRDDAAPLWISIPLGYEQAARLHFLAAESYAAARRGYAADIRARLAAATPSLSTLRAAVKAGGLGKEIIALGQDAAIDLFVRGTLRDANGLWLTDTASFERKIRERGRTISPMFGEINAMLSASEVAAYLASLETGAGFQQLRSDPIRRLYGNKALVVPALLDVLTRDLGIDSVVLTPAETGTGYILTKLARPGEPR